MDAKINKFYIALFWLSFLGIFAGVYFENMHVVVGCGFCFLTFMIQIMIYRLGKSIINNTVNLVKGLVGIRDKIK